MDMSLSKLQELAMDRGPGVLQFMGSQRVGHNWATELNWTKDGWATCVCRIVSLKVCLYVCSGLTILIETVGFPGSSVVNCPPANAGNTRDVVLIPGSGKSPKEGNGTPLQYSCLENAMDRGGCQATVLGVHKKVRHYSMAKQQYQANHIPTRLRNNLPELDNVTMRKLELS